MSCTGIAAKEKLSVPADYYRKSEVQKHQQKIGPEMTGDACRIQRLGKAGYALFPEQY